MKRVQNFSKNITYLLALYFSVIWIFFSYFYYLFAYSYTYANYFWINKIQIDKQ